MLAPPLPMLDRAASVQEDERSDPRTREMARAARASLRSYLTGAPCLAEVARSSRRVVVMPDRQFILVQEGWQPVSAHLWMDRSAGTGMTEPSYRQLPPEERAAVCARAAFETAFDGYARRWLDSYWPEVFARLWWDEGVAQLAWENPDAAQRRFEAVADELRVRVG
jgi:hypothetical protein